jgi:hypothetical protein
MLDLSKLNDLARAEIDALINSGIALSPDQIVELNALGWAVQTPSMRMELSRSRPVILAGEALWPLTMYAFDWLDRMRVDCSAITPEIGYAMRFGRGDGGELDVYGRDASKAAADWRRRLRCTPQEYAEAVSQVDRQDEKPELPTDPDGNRMGVGDFSAFLSATCGATPEFWERRCSMGYCLAVLTCVVMQNHADKRPCQMDPAIIAERALGYAVDKIRAEHIASATNG